MSAPHVQDNSLVRRVAQTIRWWSVPIVLGWLLIAVLTNVYVPQLEEVGKAHNVGLASPDAPSLKAMKRMGKVFHEYDSDSAAVIVLEGDHPLGADAHRYYERVGSQAFPLTKNTCNTSRTSGAIR